METKEGKYEVWLTPKKINGKIETPEIEEEVLKESIERMLPEGYYFMGERNDDDVLRLEWKKKNLIIWYDTIICEKRIGGRWGAALEDAPGNWMEVWYYKYLISIWYKSFSFLGFRHENKELDSVCRATAKMIEERFDVSKLDDRSWMHGTYEINGHKIKI